jgi:hypothetical protein
MDGRHVAAPAPLRLARCDTPALRAAVHRFRPVFGVPCPTR